MARFSLTAIDHFDRSFENAPTDMNDDESKGRGGRETVMPIEDLFSRELSSRAGLSFDF